MIKIIKKIDLQGNEVWQEVIVCNRCKKVLEPTDFVYETKWTAWHPVEMEAGCAYGFRADSNPVKHICEKCQEKVEKFLNGECVAKASKKDNSNQLKAILATREHVLNKKESKDLRKKLIKKGK